MSFYTTVVFLFLFIFVTGYRWTEEDESKRIAELKQEEQRLFAKQVGGRFIPNKHNSAETTFDYNSEYSAQLSSLSSADSYAPTFSSHNLPAQDNQWRSTAEKHHKTYNYPHPHKHNHHGHHLKHHHTNNTKHHWCFHCISPWHTVSSNMQQVVLNLLDLRRAKPPGAKSVVADCTQPHRLDDLPRQTCQFSYCQTLVLTDHESGSSFTLRGCAENFGAVDEKLLAERGDNNCKKLHDVVDIQECVCKHRKYCYAGANRNLDYTEDLPINGHELTEDLNNNGEVIVRHLRNGKVERYVLNSSISFRMHNSFYIVLCFILFLNIALN